MHDSGMVLSQPRCDEWCGIANQPCVCLVKTTSTASRAGTGQIDSPDRVRRTRGSSLDKMSVRGPSQYTWLYGGDFGESISDYHFCINGACTIYFLIL